MNIGNRRISIVEGPMAGFVFGTAAIFIRLLEILNAHSIAFWRARFEGFT